MKILVTGGAGYIGSTICSALNEAGHIPVILDSLINGREEFTKDKIFYKGDIADSQLVKKIFKEHSDISCVIHCAALIVVSESVECPYEYYDDNVSKTVTFLNTLKEIGCRNIIFSSSASIYGNSEISGVSENAPIQPNSPYGRTKQIVEMILSDYANAYNLKTIALRYFNPIGADPKLRSGSYIKNSSSVIGKLMSALNNNETFYITGTTWNTRDGSGLRDYIHVWDLAYAHVKAVENIEEAFRKENLKYGFIPINIGCGTGITVKELVSTFEKVSKKTLNKKETVPRAGDIAGAYAKVDKAEKLIGWKSQLSIEQAIYDALRWEKKKEGMWV